MINAESQSDIIFLSGGTEANNLVFHSVLKHYEECKKFHNSSSNHQGFQVKNLPHIIISSIEHDSVKLIAHNYEEKNLAGELAFYCFY